MFWHIFMQMYQIIALKSSKNLHLSFPPLLICHQHNVCSGIFGGKSFPLMSVLEKFAWQTFSAESKSQLRTMSSGSEVFLRNAKLRSLNELTYWEGGGSNLIQLLRALHIYRLHKQTIHKLWDVPLCGDCKQHNPQVMFAEASINTHKTVFQTVLGKIYFGYMKS